MDINNTNKPVSTKEVLLRRTTSSPSHRPLTYPKAAEQYAVLMKNSREGQYAENKRADIRVWFGENGGINIPIEIKRDSHTDLWKAIYGQLLPRYTKDPGANGYGIFLIFWFGETGMPGSPDGKRKP